MQIKNEFPPNYERIKEAFDVEGKGVLFAYGDVIYDPDNIGVVDHLEVHEGVHQRQQKAIGGPEIWWDKYIQDKAFRLSQEIEAYGEQYKFIKQHITDRNSLTKYLFNLASVLSSPMYGRVIGLNEATLKIKQASN